MFTFCIMKFISSKPLIVHQIDEEKIVARIMDELPESSRQHFLNAWNKVVKDFKKESTKVV